MRVKILLVFLIIGLIFISGCIEKSIEKDKDKSEENDLIIIFIDSNTYAQLQSEIDRYKTDIENDLYARVSIDSRDWENGNALRDHLLNLYKNDSLIGVILIGDIPTMWFSPSLNLVVNTPWPSDYLYMDLRSSIEFDENGSVNKIEKVQREGFYKRDIWVGRIKTPVDGTESIALLRDYFDRNHKYRTGVIQYDKSFLYYPYNQIEINNWSKVVCQSESERLFSENTAYDLDDVTIICSIGNDGSELYLSELSKNREWVVVNMHGDPLTQYFYNSISWSQIKDVQPGALCYLFLSCSNGDFTRENYIGGWYLFSGDGLVVYAYTVPVMPGGQEWIYYALPLSASVTFSEPIRYDGYIPLTILGDPTLKMRGMENVPNTNFDQNNISFGKVKVNELKEIDISIENKGPVEFIVTRDYVYLKGNYPSGFKEEDGGTGEFVSPFRIELEKIPSNSSSEFKFSFTPRISGEYSQQWILLTNDPKYPYLEINLEGTGVP